MLKHRGVYLEISFFWHTYLGSYGTPVLTPCSPDKTVSQSQSKVLRITERDDIRPQLYKHCWTGTGISRFILPLL